MFQDVDVRKALTMAIDRRELNRILNHPDDLPVFDVPALARHHHEGVVPDPLPFDPDRAAELLVKAGWVDTDGDGIREKAGRDFQFTLSTTEKTATQAVFIQEQFRRVGIRMEISTFDRSMMMSKIQVAHDFEAVIHQYNFLKEFGTFNASGYKNPEASRLRDIIWWSIDPEEVDRYLPEFWRIFEAEMPITYLHPMLSYTAAHRRVRGMRNDTDLFSIVEELSIGPPFALCLESDVFPFQGTRETVSNQRPH
jgi:peptide/nickel transport system substrate-binding protein